MTSGKHRGPRYLLTLESEAQRKRWEKAARGDGVTLAEWIRRACDREIEMVESLRAGVVTAMPRRKA